jgi:hypothetical protein
MLTYAYVCIREDKRLDNVSLIAFLPSNGMEREQVVQLGTLVA